ncbi:hypothetical protein GGS21DRAFT_483911 [Xylaria nigripes]|nr:hypothetical protein GGS21DRAFT_483911 [Xylaria nigripes]
MVLYTQFLGEYADYTSKLTGYIPDFDGLWASFIAWLSQSHVLAVVLAWVIPFTVLVAIFLAFGFGLGGIVAGMLAPAFQSYMYGGFTPAGGIFATLTSMAMLGVLMPSVVVGAAVVATIVASIVWACGVGRRSRTQKSSGTSQALPPWFVLCVYSAHRNCMWMYE